MRFVSPLARHEEEKVVREILTRLHSQNRETYTYA